jgi:hypothetical protein
MAQPLRIRFKLSKKMGRMQVKGGDGRWASSDSDRNDDDTNERIEIQPIENGSIFKGDGR